MAAGAGFKSLNSEEFDEGELLGTKVKYTFRMLLCPNIGPRADNTGKCGEQGCDPLRHLD
jgi:hypothetical protein